MIADDIKDETAPTAVTGKREGGDRVMAKVLAAGRTPFTPARVGSSCRT